MDATHHMKLGDLVSRLRIEGALTQADPFDDAMVAAVTGVAVALAAEADALKKLEARLGRLARRAPQ